MKGQEPDVTRHASPARRRIAVRLALGVLGLAALGAALYGLLDYRRFADAPLEPLPASASIDVPLGTSLAGVVRLLEAAGVRTRPLWYWRGLAWQTDTAGRLKAGEYALEAGLTPRALLHKMAAGEVIRHRFTIVEGWTLAQLREALARETGLRQTAIVGDDAALMRALGAAETTAEGWFLPQTYEYVKGMTDLDLLRRAFLAMRELLDREWAGRAPDLPLASPYQALILASIVEKETARAEERPRIAAVFLHRLRLGMRLQTDPSVIYGLGSAFDGKLHRRDLDTDTPFNTYTRGGLPPTPIALPGAASLAAVLHPAATDALYFVARGDGSHEFSASLAAHRRAVERYQLHHDP
jgi:UPF0755 protein